MTADITGVVLYKTEIDQLKTALQSLEWCANRIILVDGTSVDENVKAVAKTYSTEILFHPLETFDEQRNVCLKHVQTDWTIFLDVDEAVSPQLAKEVQNTIGQAQSVGLYLHRQDQFMHRVLHYGETSKVLLLRVAKTKVGNWERPVHEVWTVSGKTKVLHNSLFHTPHQSIESFIEKINRYTSLEAALRKKQGKQFSLLQFFFYPLGKFIYNYIALFGFLDGFPGLAQAWMMSFHSLVLRVKMYEHA